MYFLQSLAALNQELAGSATDDVVPRVLAKSAFAVPEAGTGHYCRVGTVGVRLTELDLDRSVVALASMCSPSGSTLGHLPHLLLRRLPL